MPTINYSKKFIFIGNARCGSTSHYIIFNDLSINDNIIVGGGKTKYLQGRKNIQIISTLPYNYHMGISDVYKSFFNNKKFHDYFKFGFVRNPWSRFYSCWQEFVLKHEIHPEWTKEIAIPKYINSFEKFCLDFPNLRIKDDIHFVPLYQQIIHDDKIALDYIGNFECMNDDIIFICNKLRFNSNPKLEHRRNSSDKNYFNKYTEETKKIIGDFYKKDIELFGYSFDNNTLANLTIKIHNNNLSKIIMIQRFLKRKLKSI
tara:strand:- start:5 stop:781 length:777 start_codon:yes stop_codon:yes gene_type:complete